MLKRETTTKIPWAMKWLLEAFSGELASTVVCGHCANESVTSEPFCDLSLDFAASCGV